ncbi:cupredoxin domain-containing protein, partial [Akkermansiaceae bacterium]|nr:cupredoxin domain-containing protein [Akkermansiaceae bacterium]
DLRFGPQGACYVCDWYNPVKGHAQYSLRDPRRDRKAGRIWRIVPKGAKLAEAPKIAGSSISQLLDHLKSPHYRTRYWAKRELRARANLPSLHFDSVMPPRDVILKSLSEWTAKQTNPLHLLEALWLHQALDQTNLELLERLIRSDDHLVAASAFGPLRFAKTPPLILEELLRYGASHPSQHVRRETVLCASYALSSQSNPSPGAIDITSRRRRAIIRAIYPTLDQPAGTHLAYAIRTSFNSTALKSHWLPDTKEKLARLSSVKKAVVEKLTKDEKKFDRQKNLATIKIGTIPERLLFTKDKFTVKAGQPVKLVFSNPDATEHNLLILAKDTPIEEIGEKSNLMAADPQAAKKQFIPDDKRILHASKMLKVGQTQTLRFKAPSQPGTYPFLCTFPGHWTIMKGEMIVK